MTSRPLAETAAPAEPYPWSVVLVNLGTPEAPTTAAVRRYLAEFLWDPRVVELPRPLWWPLLHGLVLPLRARRSAHAYRSIWGDEGSPLRVFSQRLAEALAAELRERLGREVVVELALRYGKPDLASRFQALRERGRERWLILPLYPQYSSPGTGSVFDAVAAILRRWRHLPSVGFIEDYHAHPSYIAAVAASIERFWQAHGRAGHLLISFHGLPDASRRLGDPYAARCAASARLIAQHLGLGDDGWQLVYQSRFGWGQWLKPYCLEVLKALPARGIREVDVVCPGFAVDCLETLEEIGVTNKTAFLRAGGVRYRLIPALNDSPEHARALADVVLDWLAGR